jgi:putative transposase
MSRQNYYARRRRRQRRAVDAALILELARAERQVQPRLGTRKLRVVLAGALARAGVQVLRDRFFAVLRQSGLLLSPLPREHPVTTSSYHCLPVFGNLVKDREVSGPNEVWVSDLTYLRTEESFMYLALVTDKYSRKIVGYHCGDTLEAQGCVRALEMALRELPAGAQPIHHSDQGSQYCCHEYVRALGLRGLKISMTVADHCAENALAERMNGILKSEYGLGQKLKTKALARQMTEQGVWLYNTRRPHLALNYQTPAKVHQTGVVSSSGCTPARRLACGPPPEDTTNHNQRILNPDKFKPGLDLKNAEARNIFCRNGGANFIAGAGRRGGGGKFNGGNGDGSDNNDHDK